MPRAVVVLPTNTYRASDFVKAATALGVDLVVAIEEALPVGDDEAFVQIDCSDPESASQAIAALGDTVPLDGVVAADDAGVVIAAAVTAKLGLPGNLPDAARATRDKAKMREMLARSEVSQPDYRVVTTSDEVDLNYPVVAKPLDRSASQGVIRVDRPEGLHATVTRIRSIVGQDAPVLVEQYVAGDELAVEGILRNGELTVLALFDKPDTREGPVFPETIFVTPSRLPEEVQAECARVAEAACRALGLTHGPVHVELKVEESGRAHVIEIAARSIGGLCSRSLSFGLMNTSLETLILRNALGMDKPELKKEPHASGVLMIPIAASGRLERIDGLDQATEIPGITGHDLSAHPGSNVTALPEGDAYLGFVYARGNSPDMVETALRTAMSTIQVVIS